jgi:hypothetical protein
MDGGGRFSHVYVPSLNPAMNFENNRVSFITGYPLIITPQSEAAGLGVVFVVSICAGGVLSVS